MIFKCKICFVLLALIIGSEYIFPSWVPDGAIRKAKELTKDDFIVTFQTGKRQKHKIELKYPYQVIYADYRRYEPGFNIWDLINDSTEVYEEKYGFGLYANNEVLGRIEVRRKDEWKWAGGSSGGEYDPLAIIYSKYPDGEKTKVLASPYAYFVSMGDSILEVLAMGYSPKGYRWYKPHEYMMKEKKRIEQWDRMHREAK